MTATGQSGPVLLTGFEPFDGRDVNASWAAVERVVVGWSDPVELVGLQVPVSFRGARQALRTAVAAHRPRLVVCVGEAAREVVGVERIAVNVIDARIADNDGSRPVDLPVIAGAPDAYFSTLPLRACVAAAVAAGVPAAISESAGTYVCNATFFALMHLVARGEPAERVRAGFVHVPLAPEGAGALGGAMATATAAQGLEAVVRAALG